jgi:hypothetical protein
MIKTLTIYGLDMAYKIRQRPLKNQAVTINVAAFFVLFWVVFQVKVKPRVKPKDYG